VVTRPPPTVLGLWWVTVIMEANRGRGVVTIGSVHVCPQPSTNGDRGLTAAHAAFQLTCR
jgi:hypothetical protein